MRLLHYCESLPAEVRARPDAGSAGARAQAGQRLDYQREAMREVVARTAVEPHSRAVLPSDNPKSVVLDLVQHWLPEGCSVTEILYRVYDFLTHRDAHDPLPFLPSRCGPIAVAERS